MSNNDDSSFKQHHQAINIVSKNVAPIDVKSSTACSNYRSELKENQKGYSSTSYLHESNNLSSCYSSNTLPAKALG